MALSVEFKRHFPWSRKEVSLNSVFTKAHEGAVADFLNASTDNQRGLHSWYGDIATINLLTGSQTKTDAIINTPVINITDILPPEKLRH